MTNMRKHQCHIAMGAITQDKWANSSPSHRCGPVYHYLTGPDICPRPTMLYECPFSFTVSIYRPACIKKKSLLYKRS